MGDAHTQAHTEMIYTHMHTHIYHTHVHPYTHRGFQKWGDKALNKKAPISGHAFHQFLDSLNTPTLDPRSCMCSRQGDFLLLGL